MAASCQRDASTDSSPRLEEITRPVDEDEVTKIDVGLPGRERLLADLGEGDHHLQPYAGMICSQALLQGGEAQLAGVADEHHAAGHSDDVVGLLAQRQVAPLLPYRGQRVGARNGHRIGLAALSQQPCPLLLPDLHLLGQPEVVAVARHPVSLGDLAPADSATKTVARRFISGPVACLRRVRSRSTFTAR